MNDHRYGPTSAGTVLLDLGGDTGALVLYTPADLTGAEIEISPDAPGAVRTHAAVRARPGPSGTRYAVVYDGLAAGRYTIWRDHDTPVATVTVTGGQVTSHRWGD
jgi:quercetin dioxygenase-like cupin family protein